MLTQCVSSSNQGEVEQKDFYRVVFYNVENLFDTYDEEFTFDDEFTPFGANYWGRERYNKKIKDIGKVLVNAAGEEVPAVIGLVEIENREVLEDLLNNSPLQKFQYAIVHEDSPDERGIDVALLFDTKQFEYLDYQIGQIEFPTPIQDKTRDILIVKGEMGKDTVYLAVNHWPSRRGGVSASEPKRMFVGQFLRKKVDAILQDEPNASIVLMGDFNDEPSNKSVRQSLGASPWEANGKLINLMSQMEEKGLGTYKYQNQWNMIDQFIVSNTLKDSIGHLYVTEKSAKIYQPDFLKERDPVYPGERIFRTYRGPNYIGGYSDHFPIVLDIYRR